MSEKRKDNKKRILNKGESIRPDGRYAYKYVDENGKQQFVYSWKLEHYDPIPKGKRNDISLREKEAIIQKNIQDGIVSNGGNITVLQLVERYISQKIGVRHNTQTGYKTVVNLLKKEKFGQMRIDKVKISDAKLWLIKLQNEDGKGYSTIHNYRGVLRPAFQMAVDDDYIRKNPFDFQLSTVVVNDSVTRESITPKEERAFLDFVKNDKHFSKYYEGIYILFKTGLRISEFVGLTVKDVDLKEKTININHQLQRGHDGKYYIEKTKTSAGTREIPIENDVCDCFEKIIKNRKQIKTEPMIDGYTGFLYFDKNGNPMVAMHWEKYFQHICEKYNKIYKEEMPKVTPHVCRHTYCSNMANSGMNPKHLQELMGHSNIGVTMDTYTHLQLEDLRKEVKRVNKTKIIEFKQVVNS
ncbi:MAG: site-specific integrase [Oscillospiraceae bacterium]|nr:site-specific integrase [Oscillospiraceae bacterium]